MADVTLAEVGGIAWLVAGDEHIDGILANMLPPTATIEVIAFPSRADAWAFWQEKSPDAAAAGGMPWVINPAIMRRIKGSLGDQCIRFTPWSAMLTEEARALIATTAEWLASKPDARVTLRQFGPAEPPAGLADLQRLRGQLVSAALTGAGGDAARLDAETAASDVPEDSERLDLVGVTAAGIAGG